MMTSAEKLNLSKLNQFYICWSCNDEVSSTATLLIYQLIFAFLFDSISQHYILSHIPLIFIKLQGTAEGSVDAVKGSSESQRMSKGTRRSSTQGWTSSLAPRFERKAAAEQKQIYYEGEFCEADALA